MCGQSVYLHRPSTVFSSTINNEKDSTYAFCYLQHFLMMSSARILSMIAFLAALFSLALSVPLAVRDVYTPPVLYPHNGTVWKVGQRHNVTW